MKHIRKRILSLLMTFAMLLSMVPVNAFAAEMTPPQPVGVAQIGEVIYPTLPEAVEAAKAGDTVTLTADVTLNEGAPADGRYDLFVNKDLTIDGAGHTITNGLARGIGVQAQNVTFKNVTINNALPYGRGIDTRGSIGTFTLDGVTINTTGSGNCQPLTIGGNQASNANIVVKNSTLNAGAAGYCVLMFNPVNMTITGSTLDGWGILYFKGPSGSAGTDNSTIMVEASKIISKNAHSGSSNSFGAVVYENVSGNAVTLKDCQVEVSTTGDQTQELFCFSNGWGAENNTNTITGNTTVIFSGNGTITASEMEPGNSVAINGGSFNVDPTPYLADGFKMDQDENGNFVVAAKDYVAAIGEAKFETLQAAVDAAQKDDTIQLLKDTTSGKVTITNKNLTLDLGGYTLDLGDASINTVSNGAMTVTVQNGTVKSAKTAFVQQGTLKLVNAKVEAGVNGIDTRCSKLYVDENSSIHAGEYAVHNYWANNDTPSVIDIKGSLTSDKYAVYMDDYDIVFNAYEGAVVNGQLGALNIQAHPAEINISGGTFGENFLVLNKNPDTTKDDEAKKITVNITGGTFNGTIVSGKGSGLKAGGIKGGTFAEDPTAYLAKGYEAVSADNAYTVEQILVAEVNGTQYPTLQEAVKAAQPGETVVVLRDLGTNDPVVIDKKMTLNLNGKTITFDGDAGDKKLENGYLNPVTGADLTITGNGTVTYNNSDNYTLGMAMVASGDAVVTVKNGHFHVGLTAVQIQDTVVCNIEGGTFEADFGYSNRMWILNKIDRAKDTAVFNVTGGTFVKYDPSNSDTESPTDNFVNKDYKAVKNGENYTVIAKDYVAEVNGVKFESLAEAVAAAQPYETVVVLKNIVLSETVVVDKNIKIDLNGKTISSAEGFDAAQYMFETKAPEVKYKKVQICNGSIVSATARGVHATAGRLYLEAVNMNTFKRCLHVEHAEVKLDQGSVLEICQGGIDPTVFIGSKDTTSTKQPTLEVKSAKLDASKGKYAFAAIQGNGSDTSNPYIKVFDGAELISAGDAIYAPQEGLVYIYGGTLTGSTAIEIRAGRLYIKGGVFNATAAQFAEQPSGNGSTVEGTAVAVSQHTTNKDLDVTILDGTFNGIYAFYEKDLQDAKVANITGSVRGGNFNGKVYSQNLKNFIKEGIFTEEPAAEYIAEGYAATQNADGKFVVAKKPVAMIGTQGYETLRDAVKAAKSGDTVQLVENIELTRDYGFEQICVTTKMTLNFNGHTITTNHAGKNNTAVLFVNAGGDLTLKGEGGINVLNGGYCVHVNGADAVVNVEDGTYHGAVTAINVQKGTANVKGGSFSVTPTADGKYDYLLNCIDGAYNDGSAKIVVTGGTFAKFNPAASNGEPNGPVNLVAKGYESTKAGESWTVAVIKDPVAKIGEIGYKTFKAAFDDAQVGDTIELVRGFVGGKELAQCTGKEVNVILGGEGLNPRFNIAEDIVLTDVHMNLQVKSGAAFLFENRVVTDKVSLTLNGGTVLNVDGLGTGNLGVMSAVVTVNVEGEGTQLNAKNMKGNATNGGTFNVTNGAALTMDGAGSYGLSCNGLNVDNATVTIKNTGYSGVYASNDGVKLTNGAKLTVESCGRLLPLESKWSHTYAPVQLKNGNVSVDTTSSIVLNNNVDKNGNSINYIHSNNKNTTNNYAVAQITGDFGVSQFLTLQDAVATAKSGETVKLINNAATNDPVVIDKKMTLDMNGKTITFGGDAGDKKLENGYLNPVNGADLTITGNGTVTYNNSDNYTLGMAMVATGDAKVTIENGTFHAGLTAVQIQNTVVCNIKGGTFKADFGYSDRMWILNKMDDTKATCQFNVTGGTFVKYDPANSDTENPVENFVAAGYESIQDGENYIVKQIMVAEVNGTKYPTLQEAVKAAKSGETVKLIRDAATNDPVVIDKKMTLDMNGKTITFDGDAGDKKLENGYLNPVNGADLTITGNGTVTYNNSDNYTLGMAMVASGDAKVTIENGTFHAGLTAVQIQDTVVCNIKGGTFKADFGYSNRMWILNKIDRSKDTAVFNVTGGTFVKYDPANSDTENPSDNFVATGYESVKEGDNYIVKQIMVAEVNGTQYATLAEAVAAAKPGDTVKLIRDVVMPYPTTAGSGLRPDINIDKDLTLDLAGHTIKRNECTGSVNGVPAFFAITAGVKVTVTGNGVMDTELGDNSSYGINLNHPDAVLTIENGSFLGAPTAIQVQQGTLNVKGGTFDMAATCKAAAPAMAKYIINCIDKSFKDGTAKISVTGGAFAGFDPSADPEGAGTTYVAPDYKTVKDGEYYKVVSVFVAQNLATDKTYTTVSTALQEANQNDTIQMIGDSQEDMIIVRNEVTLDLNGHTLATDYLGAFTGSRVIDSAATKGLLKTSEKNVALPENNPNVPVWNGVDGYQFAAMNMSVQGFNTPDGPQTSSGTEFKVGFKPLFGKVDSNTSFAGKYFKDNGCTDNKLKIVLRLTWSTEKGSATQDFVYSDQFVEEAYQNGRAYFTMSVAGLNGISNLKIQTVVISDLGVEAVSNEMNFTVAQAQ